MAAVALCQLLCPLAAVYLRHLPAVVAAVHLRVVGQVDLAAHLAVLVSRCSLLELRPRIRRAEWWGWRLLDRWYYLLLGLCSSILIDISLVAG
jgi:hypothetical protein